MCAEEGRAPVSSMFYIVSPGYSSGYSSGHRSKVRMHVQCFSPRRPDYNYFTSRRELGL